MRSDDQRSRRVLVLLALLGATLSCGGSDGTDTESATGPEPTEPERVACERVQQLVDAVVDGEALSAMSGLTQMEAALADSGSSTLETSGREFFDTISGTVPNPGDLTVEETAQVGNRALAAAQPALQQLLDECARLGLTIENLPTGEGRP